MSNWIILLCAGAAVAVFMLLLVAGLCRAAARTDEYLDRWEAEHERHHH